MALRSLLAAALIALSTTAQAADANGAFAFKGAGLRPCSALVEAMDGRDPVVANYAGWLMGFVSGVNLFREDTFDMVPWQSPELLLSALANHCRADPAVPVHRAVVLMLDRMTEARLEERSELVTVFEGPDAVVLYREVVARIEARLEEEGFLEAPAASAFDEATREALAAFQQAHGLQATGFPDQRTLFTLFELARPGGG